jgi:hypothetical protein
LQRLAITVFGSCVGYRGKTPSTARRDIRKGVEAKSKNWYKVRFKVIQHSQKPDKVGRMPKKSNSTAVQVSRFQHPAGTK